MTVAQMSIYALLTFGALVGAWAIVELVPSLYRAYQLGVATGKLNADPPEQPAFPSPASGPLAIAASVANKLVDPNTPTHYHPDPELRHVAAVFASQLGRPRALAGLLIIVGLLITLSNLRNAVDEMRRALDVNPPSPSSETGVSAGPPAQLESSVRQGISGIATAAARAFGYSAAAILLASMLLCACIATQRVISQRLNRFAAWAYERMDLRLSVEAAQPSDTADKLALTADSLVRVAVAFETTNTALRDVNAFGGILNSAVERITEAVAALPDEMDESMAKISTDVAQGISAGLEHQAEYLRGLIAIYAEHTVTLGKVCGFITQIAADHKTASAALSALSSLPKEIRGISVTVQGSSSANISLKTVVESLEGKVAALPGAELRESAAELRLAAAKLVAVDTAIVAFKESALESSRSTNERVSTLGESVARLSHDLETLTSQDATTGTAMAAIATRVAALAQELGSLRNELRVSGASALADLYSQLEREVDRISQQLADLPWSRLVRLMRSALGSR